MKEDTIRYALYILGIITALYIVVRYVIPLVFKIVAGLMGIVFNVVIFLAIVFGVIWGIGYLSKSMRR
ncbi:MAG: hypothetical protein EPN93_07455 [Spirochaetes bacterium]|nr:MAG: hypothetical protein EPN93_07455 [Spirochaetota bacterium]